MYICMFVTSCRYHVAYDFIPSDSTSMCAQTIFSALDFLTAWTIAKNKAAIVRKSKGIPQKGTYVWTYLFVHERTYSHTC